MVARETIHSDSAQLTLLLLQELLGDCQPCHFAVRLWDGTTWAPKPGQPARFTLVLQHPGALRQMLSKPSQLNLAEAYLYDDFDIEGDVEALVEVGEYLLRQSLTFWEKLHFGRSLLKLPADNRSHKGRLAARLQGERHSLERDRQAISYHYDVSNEFYGLFLDQRLVYSCAYFAHPEEDLGPAQERKLDYLCRKLCLAPGERLLDIGCGWGGLILHAAQHYGVDALGITLSQHQADLANERIRQAGLGTRCRVELCDYRELSAAERFDKMVSVGMVEHVGNKRLAEYFEQAWHHLRPGGVFLNHGIGKNATAPPKKGVGFVGKYVFPDGELLPIHTMLQAAEQNLFEVRDVESLREHYALTLRHWVRRLEAHYAEARRHVDEVTYRIWRLYMAGCASWFARGYLNVYQTLLIKQDQGRSHLPLTRADWYL